MESPLQTNKQTKAQMVFFTSLHRELLLKKQKKSENYKGKFKETVMQL